MICYPPATQLWAVPFPSLGQHFSSLNKGCWSSSECPSSCNIPWCSEGRPSSISHIPSLSDLIRRVGGGKKKKSIFCDRSQFVTSEIKDGLVWKLLNKGLPFPECIFSLVGLACPTQGVFGSNGDSLWAATSCHHRSNNFPSQITAWHPFSISWSCFPNENLDSNVFFTRLNCAVQWVEGRSQNGSRASSDTVIFLFGGSSLDIVKLANEGT